MESNKNNPTESKLHFLDYWRIIRIRKTVILAVFLLVVLTTTIVTFLLKPTYMSSVRIAIEKDSADIAPLLTGVQSQSQYDPYWIQTEFEKIQSKLVLHRVINGLGLNTKWGPRYGADGPLTTNETFLILQKSIDVNQYRNTSLIEIKAYSEDKTEAAVVANRIAEEYRGVRWDQQLDLSRRGVDALELELNKANRDVVNKQREVDTLKRDLKITDIYTPEGTSYATSLEPQTIQRLEAQRGDAQANYVQYNALLTSLIDMNRTDLRKAALTALPGDSELSSLIMELAQAEQQLVTQSSIQGPEHPQIKSLKDLLGKLNEQVEEKLDGILLGLAARVNSAAAQVSALADAVEFAKEREAKTTAEHRPYFQVKRELENLQKIRDMILIRKLQEMVDSQLPKNSIVEIYDRAEPALKAIRPNIPLNIALGVVVGLVVGVGLAFFIEYLDTSVKTIDDVESALQAPVLGVIPQNVGSLMDEGPDSPHAEAYRVLRTNVLFSRKDPNATTITVVSGGAGEGKSTTIFNLAMVFAQNGQRVLVVDSDLRRPSIHKMLGVSNSIGLTNFLMRQNNLEEVIQTTKDSNLDFLPSGKLPSSSMGILNSTQMKEFVKEVKNRYDFVFFDSPPIMGVSDASILASEVDLSLLVIQYRKYPQAMTIRAKQMVQKVGGNLLGVVLNNINISQDSYYYYYSGYYYDYYSKRDDDDSSAPSKNGGTKSKETTAARGGLDLKKKY